MRSQTLLFGVLLILGLTCAHPLIAQDSGATAVSPWSGYWWPHQSGGLTKVYRKYDALFGTKAMEWEQENNVNPAINTTADTSWWGKCNAWAAASSTEKQPTSGIKIKDVQFTVGDLKGLLTACHEGDAANFYGQRYNGDRDNRGDLSPEELWRVLQLYVGRDRIPLILDLDSGVQVWNYPAYQYRVDHEVGAGGLANCTMQILVAEDNVPVDYVGTRATLHHYTFTARMENGAIIDGTGQWTGNSVIDHPDFAWYPQVTRAENPHINAAEVARIIRGQAGPPNPPMPNPPTPNPPMPNPPTPNPPMPNPPTPGPVVDFDTLFSPQELLDLVSNRTSHFKFDAFIEGGDGAKFDAGKPIKLSVKSGERGYLYVFDIDADGDLSLVFPLEGEKNLVEKDTNFELAPRLVAAGHGQHDLKSIILASPITMTGFRSDQTPNYGVPNQTKPPGTKPATTKPVANKPSPVQQLVPQKMRLCQTAKNRSRDRLLGVFRKGQQEEPTPSPKTKRFAQDSTSYFVMDLPPRTGQKPDQSQQPKPNPQQSVPEKTGKPTTKN